MEDELVCITLVAEKGESEADFKARLTEFWTHMLRNRPDDYEKVYAEATEFETAAGAVARQYMIEMEGLPPLLEELPKFNLASLPVDEDDTYSRFEAAGSEWFRLEH